MKRFGENGLDLHWSWEANNLISKIQQKAHNFMINLTITHSHMQHKLDSGFKVQFNSSLGSICFMFRFSSS